MSKARMDTLEDAYKSLIKVKESNVNKKITKDEYQEMKTNERVTRQKEQGQEGTVETMLRRQHPKKPKTKTKKAVGEGPFNGTY